MTVTLSTQTSLKHVLRRPYLYTTILACAILLFYYAWMADELLDNIDIPDLQDDISIPDLQAGVDAAKRVAFDGRPYVILTMANYPYRDFTANLHCSLKATGDGRLLVVSLDERMHALARRLGMASAHFATLGKRLTGRLHRFGTAAFRVVTKRKLAAVRAVLATGVDVLFNDGDVSWCTDAAGEFADYARVARVDVAAQRTRLGTDRINSGVYFVRHSPRTLALFDEMLRRSDRVKKNDDQEMFNDIMCRSATGGAEIWNGGGWRAPEFCHWAAGNVTMGFMPEQRFPIGCSRVAGKRLMRWKLPEVRKLCRAPNPQFGLIHFSCWSIGSKHRAMDRMGLWRWDKQKQQCKA